ncbi:response regulator transcription factor [Albibacterium profundi]|uniref:Response regulator transcription factor n=1 Tax=Albibacterium profundi TaxID=3134906 RepID=A0ABV5CC87_9SPHI
MKIKILFVADRSFAAEELISSVGEDEIFELQPSVNTRKALVVSLRQDLPDILVLDINLPLVDGIDALLAISRKYPSVKTIVISDYRSPRLIAEIKTLGAKGYFVKGIRFDEFKKMALEVYEGLTWGEHLDATAVIPKPYYLSEELRAYHLTEREVEVIQLTLKDFNRKEISDFLFLSEFAIQTIMENIYVKLGIQNENQLISFAKEKKIVD